MRSAAIRVLVFVILGLGAVSSSAAMAGEPLDPIGTITPAISTITSQTTVVSDLTGSVTTVSGSGATGAMSGANDAVAGSGVLGGSGTTSATSSGADGSRSASTGDASSGSARESNRGSPQTRFDRLPRRYESLLERIESGRHVRANMARLRALLASASPQLRARVMRFIRLEIRRLERGGLTRRERAAAQRLRTLLNTLQRHTSRPAAQGPLSLGRVEDSRTLAGTVRGGGAAAATAGSESGFEGRRPTSGRDEASSATPSIPPLLLLPSSDPAWPLAVLLSVLAAIACFVLLLSGPPRHLLPSPVRGMVEVRRPEVLALAVAVGLGLAMGLVSVLLVQAFLP
jgi:hypothetical protein